MTRAHSAMAAVLAAALSALPAAWAGEPPSWAYPPCPTMPAHADATLRVSVPGSSVRLTEAQVKDFARTPDWFPAEHPAMPAVLAASRSPGKAGCGYCHLPDGSGRPENAKLAGLPRHYIVAQVKALHAGERRAGQPHWPPTRLMVESIAELGDAEIGAAADYFSHRAAKSFVRVLERERVPAYRVACFIEAPRAGAGSVPLGARILEMPLDLARFELRDPHARYVAYVPPGSIARGRARSAPCAPCHGADLKGGAQLPGPPLAGRFASYLFRQLFAFQSGARDGASALPMRAVVANMTERQMIDLAAYAASLAP